MEFMKAICVFCSSSKYIEQIYFDEVSKLSEEMVRREIELVWGGADIGLMGHVARSIQERGGIVRGVLPKSLLKVGLEYRDADELIITEDMSMRKNTMNDMSDAYICLPGGFGTLEEILEVITLKQLGYLDKPIVFFNINNFYDEFFKFIDHMVFEKIVKESGRDLYFISNNVNEILDYISNYKGIELENKW